MPGRGVLGPLALVAVGQQQHEARRLTPLVVGGHEEVVDDDLGAVGEVAELRLPRHQGVGGLHRVAVLETHRRVLRQQRVVDPEAPDVLAPEVGQRDPLLPRAVVDEHGVALAEGPAPGVLARQAHVGALEQDRPEGQSLAERPVHLALGHHPGPLVELAHQLGVHREALGHGVAAAARRSSSSRATPGGHGGAAHGRRRRGPAGRVGRGRRSGGSRPGPPAGGPGSPRGRVRPPRG